MKTVDVQDVADVDALQNKIYIRKIIMVIRKLERTEHDQTRFLYEEVFSQDSKAFVDYYYSEKTKDNDIYVVEEEGNICAMLHLNPYTLMVEQKEKDAHYIVAVATRESYRKRGFMKGLLKQALNDMYVNGEMFTFLMPASESIYLPYDFRTVYEQNQRYYQEADLQENEFQVQELKAEECEELAEAANQHLGLAYQIYALRSAAYYDRLMKEYGSDGVKLMLYRKEGKIVDMRPFIPQLQSEHKPKIMIRIVDVRRVLMNVQLKSLMAVCFHITDPIIEENNRCVVITGTEFSGVMLMDSKPENSEGTITIAALASLVFGEKTVEEICEEENVLMSERMKSEMKKIIPMSRIYLNEIV